MGPGKFTGELSLLSGRRAFGHIRVSETGDVIEIDRADLLSLIQTDGELSDILMRAFILRRVELIARCAAAVGEGAIAVSFVHRVLAVWQSPGPL